MIWTKVGTRFAALAAVLAITALAVASPAWAKKKTSHVAPVAKRAPAQANPQDEFELQNMPTPEAILEILRRIATRRTNCDKVQHDCTKREKVLLKRYEETLRQFHSVRQKVDFVLKENTNLRHQQEILESSKPLETAPACYKKVLLRELMINHGISENGNFAFSKRPSDVEGARCWSNSRKKHEASVTLCDFPLAVNILTKGGDSRDETQREREYIFSLNKCDLLTVRIHDQNRVEDRVTDIAYPTCIAQWNKRAADAAMTSKEVKLMEDTIGFCFREHLLPPPPLANGRSNPVFTDKPQAPSPKH